MITLRHTPPSSVVAARIQRHVGLVGVLVAERLRTVPRHVIRDDLMSAGMTALVLSARAYDPTRGVPFPLFASFRIRGALLDELRAMDWASRAVRSRARDIEAVRAELMATLGRAPRNDEVAAAMGISSRELDRVHSDLARGTVLSLHTFATDSLPVNPVDTDGRANCPEALILHREQIGYLHDAIAALPERLRFVVFAYYFEQRQMSDIAARLAVTQSRVSQMCTEATALLRDGMNSQLDPESMPALPNTGRAAASRRAYYQAMAARNTVAGRLAMSHSHGEVRHGVYAEHAELSQRVRAG